MVAFNSVSWRTHAPHLALLSEFRFPSEPKYFDQKFWAVVLGEPAAVAIQRFASEGWLIPSSLTEKLDRLFRVFELKDKLRARALPVSGRKHELIARLVEADSIGLEKELAGREFLECSSHAREVAEHYVAEQVAKGDVAQAQTLAFLRQHDFMQVIAVEAKFDASQTLPRGIGFNWDASPSVEILRGIFGPLPKILQGLHQTEREPFCIATAMCYLWGWGHVNRWLPPGVIGIPRLGPDTTARMILFHAQHLESLNRYRSEGLYTEFRILTVTGQPTDNSCDICQRLAERTFTLDVAPELPYEHCTNKWGCRCELFPIISNPS